VIWFCRNGWKWKSKLHSQVPRRYKGFAMLKITGFNLQSFAVGCKHTRAFSVNDVGGVIADYTLGECGVPNSPFPEKFYDRVAIGTGSVELSTDDSIHSFIVTADKTVLTEKTPQADNSLSDTDVEEIFNRAKHLMPNTLDLIKKPKTIFLGMAWQFAEATYIERERFNHPAAKSIADRIINIKLHNMEHPSEANVRLSFRKVLEKSYFIKGMNDYINVNLNIADTRTSTLWPDKSKDNKQSSNDNPRVAIISVDIQRMFDPCRELAVKSFDIHWQYCQQLLKGRIQALLGEIGFDKT